MKKILSTPLSTFQAIFLDFDGVLAESMNVKTEAFIKLFEPYGDEIVKKIVQHHKENGGISRYRKLQFYYSEYLHMPLSEQKLEELAQQFSDIVVEKVIEAPEVNGVKKFLNRYYKIIDLYVVSGTPQQEIRLIIQKRGMKKYFKGIYGIPDTKPTIIRRILTEKGYNRKKVLYIGDSLSDYYDALEVNIPFFGRVIEKMAFSFPENVPVFSDFFDLLENGTKAISKPE
jgi:phosphoglycolate phosphatase-like HAD superfamily hydrolase